MNLLNKPLHVERGGVFLGLCEKTQSLRANDQKLRKKGVI